MNNPSLMYDKVISGTYSNVVLQELLGCDFFILSVHCDILRVAKTQACKILNRLCLCGGEEHGLPGWQVLQDAV
jgi:hypothetical protein